MNLYDYTDNERGDDERLVVLTERQTGRIYGLWEAMKNAQQAFWDALPKISVRDLAEIEDLADFDLELVFLWENQLHNIAFVVWNDKIGDNEEYWELWTFDANGNELLSFTIAEGDTEIGYS